MKRTDSVFVSILNTIDLGPDPKTGKRRQKTKRGFLTKKEAEQAAAKVENELSAGTFVQEKDILFKDFAQEWIHDYESIKKISTVRPRKNQLNHILRYFAHLKLKNVTKQMYQGMLDDLKKKGYAETTIDGIHSTGRMIFRRAMEKDYLQINPTVYAVIPRNQKTVEDLEEDELPNYLEKDELFTFIEIDPNILASLKSHKAQQTELKMKHRNIYDDHGFVFVKTRSHFGNPEIIKTIERRMKRLLKFSYLNEDLTPHSLRHTHVSLLAEAGVPLEDIMDRIGHIDDKTTRNVYLHVTKSRKKEASQKFSELMGSIQKS